MSKLLVYIPSLNDSLANNRAVFVVAFPPKFRSAYAIIRQDIDGVE